ncbi:hydroxymyristoyl-ACP dehydratase [Arcticibacterium luteifluviistationis]|uniref:Hydroxymyristoyl-ACP dehydratase n=1 Tax=Arcticibacterium luteifluviistationis TaxID=1784714 RepID=A0A2Z4GDG8_9BACT|nr:hydroxymyristoyl-ACP dehydratase [Arcticibacterium luteifluviistationis]AWV99160.1 hydroxymyristoyl-ACP dehydratase [Arcticibacterium luteifluviistationis]
MLLDSFFQIKNIGKGETTVVDIELNPNHDIYKGHFPDMPVVPGVCQVQMFKEVLEVLTETKLQLVKDVNLKFMSVLNPLENALLSFELKYSSQEDGSLKASGTLSANGTKFFSTKSTYSLK